jgi:pimeloyl-ACP methyl ester carboxylesterase
MRYRTHGNEGPPIVFLHGFGGSLEEWEQVVAKLPGARCYSLDLPGFARHVIATRATIGVAQQTSTTEFSVGGTSGQSAELLPGVVVGDPSRTFSLRGVAPGTQRGLRALAGGVEYRAPLVMFRRLPSPFTLFVDRMSVTLFSDAARAWCPGALARSDTQVCERPGERDGWLASAGAELVVDLAVQYDTPYRVRIGAAAPYVAPRDVSRGGAFYVTLGGYF